MIGAAVVYWVEWVDSANLDGGAWVDLEDGMSVELCTTAGFLVRDEPEFVVLAATLDENAKRGAGLISIPRSAIRQMKPWAHEGTP